jgi:hypothetical protein
MSFDSLDGVSFNELALCAALSMCFEDVNSFDVVLGAEYGVLFDGFD